MGNTSQSCKNCGASVSSSYCSNCGQSAKTGRINFHYLLHEIQHSIFHVDKGILYTIKELALRPGKTIKDYLDGKRVNYFKPFGFVIILGTIYGFIAHFLNVYPESGILKEVYHSTYDLPKEYTQNIVEAIYSRYAFVMLASMPFAALSSFILFRKKGYNYWEHLIINCYILGIQIFTLIIFYFLYYFQQSEWIHLATSFIIYGYTIWVFIQLFGDKSKIRTGFKAFLSLILTIILFIIFVFIIVFLVMFISYNFFPK